MSTRAWTAAATAVVVAAAGLAIAQWKGVLPGAAPASRVENVPVSAPASGCAGETSPITLDRLLGQWVDGDTGEVLDVSGTAGSVHARGRHSWDGSFAGGVLKLSRVPEVGEMGNAPEWARQQARTRLKWELELTPKDNCGEVTLEGPWYPGEFKWASSDPATPGTISDVTRGTPTNVRYTLVPPAILGVAVLEDQTRNDQLGTPYYQYPFDTRGGIRSGVDNTGSALTIRTLFVYGENLPRTRDQKISITSDDPNLEYLVLAVKRDTEVNPALRPRFDEGYRAAKRLHPGADGAVVDRLDGLLVRATLHGNAQGGLLPGTKSFTLNASRASWHLRFGDDVALVSFARAATGAPIPASLSGTDVQLLESAFVPERVFVEVRTQAPLPLSAIPLRVSVGGNTATWNGAPAILATRVPGVEQVYRTPAIDLVEGAVSAPGPAGGYALPVAAGERLLAVVADPWLLRQAPLPAIATVYSGPGDLGHTYKYYLRRAAIVDGLPENLLATTNPWAVLGHQKAATIRNVAVITGLGGLGKPRTWKQQLIDQYEKVRSPLLYYFQHRDQVVEHVDVSVAEHAALLFYRDTFVDSMNRALDGLQRLKSSYDGAHDVAGMRGLRENLKAFAWSPDSPWTRMKVTCPDGASCPFSYALSDSFLQSRFPNDPDRADAWATRAMAEALGKMIDAGTKSRDRAKDVPEKDVKALIDAVGYTYEPLLPEILPRLMKEDPSGVWVPDLSGIYSLRELHTLTDAVAAQQDLATADALAVLQLAMVPVSAMEVPALVSAGLSHTAAGWAMFFADYVVTDLAPTYFLLPDVDFALGASLAVGAEHLNAAAEQRSSMKWGLIPKFATKALLAGAIDAGKLDSDVAGVGRSTAMLARGALQRVKAAGLPAFKRLQLATQEAVLALMLRAKSVQAAGALDAAGAFERDAVEVADRLAREAGVTPPAAAPEPVVAATGRPEALAAAEPPLKPKVRTLDGEVLFPQDELEAVQGKTPGLTPVRPAPAAQPNGAADADPRWRGAPAPNTVVELATTARATTVNYSLGKRVGVGAYAWVYELEGVNGVPPRRPLVMKLGGRSDDAFFTPRDVVTNSRHGYDVLRGANFRTLQTDFYPEGLLASRPGGTMPFMVQEALGERRLPLDRVLNRYGDKPVPDSIQELIAEFYARLRDAGLRAEDLGARNLYVELPPGMKLSEFYSGQVSGAEIGVLDFDRLITQQEYLHAAAGEMGSWMAYCETVVAANRVPSMRAVWNNPLNTTFVRSIEARNADGIKLFFRNNPGPYWGADTDYFYEKMLEYHGFVKFNEQTGAIGDGTVKLSIVKKYFPLIDDSSRYEPFRLGDAPAPATGTVSRDEEDEPWPLEPAA